MTEHSRFSLTNAAELPPGKCWVTGTPSGPLVDTGVEIQFAQRGRLYLSVDVVREMAEIAGLFQPLKDKAAENYDLGLEAGKKELSGNLDRAISQLDSALDTLRSAGVPVEATAEVGGSTAEVVVSAESSPDGASSSTGQSTRTGRKPRPVGIPAGAVNEPFRI